MRYQKTSVFKFLMVTLVLTLIFTGCATQPSVDQSDEDEVTQWSFYSAYGEEEGACGEVWSRLFDEIEEATEGRLVIDAYWYGQHPYEGEDMLRVLEEGNAQLSHFYSGYLTAVEPVFGVDAIPMLLPTDPMEAWEVIARIWGNFDQDRSGVLEDILQERWNASMVHMLPASPQRFFTAGYEIEDINSLKGHKVRVYSPELAKLVEIMGGTPVSVSFGEVYTSLATNLIDGLVTSTAFAESGGFFDFCDAINMWEIMSGTDGLMVSQEALNNLPSDVKAIFLEIMHESAMKPEMLELNQNDEIVEMLVQSGKVKAVVPTQENRDEVIEIVKKEIWEPWMEAVGDDGQRVLNQIEN